MLTFYCGINERKWNHHPVAPGEYACIAPVYGSKVNTRRTNSVSVPSGVQVIQDSGAFSDGPGYRLSFEKALERQIAHAEKYGYARQITHRASYDLLIDEKWLDGSRSKKRWSEDEAWSAVNETVAAAEYIVKHRDGVGLVLSSQGVSAQQYLECTRRIVPLLTSADILGLGGWCITGKFPKPMMPVFKATMDLVIPYAARHNIKRVHVWGVLHAPALAHLLWRCDQHGIHLSTDSSGPTTRPCFGAWGYADWTDLTNRRPPVEIRGLERARHVQAVRDWLASFRNSQYYRELVRPTKPIQLSLFEMAA